MKKYLPTNEGAYPMMGMGMDGLYGRVPQSAPLNLVDEYDKGLATIQQWGMQG